MAGKSKTDNYLFDESLLRKQFEELYSYEDDLENKEAIYEAYKNIKQNTNSNNKLELLLNIVVSNIDNQNNRKNNIESRSGFILAFIGAVTYPLLEIIKDDELHFGLSCGISVNVLLFLSCVIGVASILCSLSCVFSNKLKSVSIDNHRLLMTSVKDEDYFLLESWISHINVYRYNERIITKKGNIFNISVILTFIYTIVISIIYLLN